MDIADKPELDAALLRLSSRIGLPDYNDLLSKYLYGDAEELLAYEKVGTPEADTPALVKYAIGSHAYLIQPRVEARYDIFRAARMIPIVRSLDRAIEILDAGDVAGRDKKINLLSSTRSMDSLDATIFEIVTAAAYQEAAGTSQVTFLEGANPDLHVVHSLGELFVECKRFDRMTNASMPLRNTMRDKLALIPVRLRKVGKSAIAEVTISAAPESLEPEEIATAALQALASHDVAMFGGGHVTVQELAPAKLDSLQLFPAPNWYWKRYRFKNRDPWHAIIVTMEMALAGPSFLESVAWDVGVKWRITDPAVTWRTRRIGFSRLFKGLRQLEKTRGKGVTALHVGLERAGGEGHRRTELLAFIAKLNEGLASKTATSPDILVFNEVDADVSLGGRFDFTEFAHIISPAIKKPPVSTVFTAPEDWKSNEGEWGVGPELPSIDEE